LNHFNWQFACLRHNHDVSIFRSGLKINKNVEKTKPLVKNTLTANISLGLLQQHQTADAAILIECCKKNNE